jgi:hypothetical protein
VGVVGFLIFVAFVIFVIAAQNKNPRVAAVRNFQKLETSGRRGRALVLYASQLATGTTSYGQRYLLRSMTLEIEIPGEPPYEVSGTFAVPRGLVEPIPGSSLEVSVDPSDNSQLAVLGPGGFTGPWLSTGVPQPY